MPGFLRSGQESILHAHISQRSLLVIFCGVCAYYYAILNWGEPHMNGTTLHERFVYVYVYVLFSVFQVYTRALHNYMQNRDQPKKLKTDEQRKAWDY